MTSGTTKCNQAYEYLRKQLLYCQLPPNMRLAETQWAPKLNVHRPALREAMTLLAHEGLLRRGDKGGFFTISLTLKQRRDILTTRSIIEAGAIRLYNSNPPTPQQIEELSDACNLLKLLIEAKLDISIQEADRSFHEILVELSGNASLIHLYERSPLPFEGPKQTDEYSMQKRLKTLADLQEVIRYGAVRRLRPK
ncbi:MAG TPA: GntR family transcriptional regulator, partial [Phycisphaerae bacterium]|nr:GntR family transcriptional regulator [Phycisphaerae bacterium]